MLASFAKELQNMLEVLEQLKQLRQLSGNAQVDLLKSFKCELLKDVLDMTYNPHKKYKIDESKFNKISVDMLITTLPFYERDWQIFKRKLELLQGVKSATDELVLDMKEFIYQYNPEFVEFLKMVLFKDLRLNMAIKKFQKVWPDFCEEPQVQLAQKLESQSFSNGFYSRKLDGSRAYVLDLSIFSRSNKLHKEEPLKHIINQLSQLPQANDFVFDGELIYLKDGKEDFQKAISLIRSDKRTFECDDIYFVVFDLIPKKNFIEKVPFVAFSQEYDLMKKYFNVQKEGVSWYETLLPNILLIRQVTEEGRTELELARNEYNWEGLMYRDGNASYEYKRTNKLLKIKAMQDIELKLIDMEEGTGKHAGRLGAFVLEYENSVVRMGSGFSDEQRIEYWNNRDKYIGEYVKTQYFEKTINQDGTHSLRFPVFLAFRDDITGEFLLK